MSSADSLDEPGKPGGFTDTERADLFSALNEWLGVLDRVVARELDAARREQLMSGAEQLREIVDGMLDASGPGTRR